MFQGSAHTVAMIQHSIDVVENAVQHLNPGQTPVVTFDQSLFALAKQIQWKWPEDYGEVKVLMMFGGLHIEMAALKTLGDRLDGSGWVQALIQTEITIPGTADPFTHPVSPAQGKLAKSLWMHSISCSTMTVRE